MKPFLVAPLRTLCGGPLGGLRATVENPCSKPYSCGTEMNLAFLQQLRMVLLAALSQLPESMCRAI